MDRNNNMSKSQLYKQAKDLGLNPKWIGSTKAGLQQMIDDHEERLRR